MDRRLSLACLAALVLGLAACQGKPVGLTAQQGSSVLIPLDVATNPDAAAYGGTEVPPDYQRGALVFRLDGPTGFELVTRAASAVMPVQSAKLSKVGAQQQVVPRQIAVLVDIPTDAPLGLHSLHVVRERGGTEYPGPAYHGELTILPNQINVGGNIVTGQSTPFQWYSGTGWTDIFPGTLAGTIPRPELQVDINPAVHSIELQVDYPAGVINVLDSFQTALNVVPINERGIVWHDDDGVGRVVISAAATTPGRAVDALSLVFGLDDGANAILDTADIDLTVLSATDATGASISPAVSVNGIY